jgi:hypothetical protein
VETRGMAKKKDKVGIISAVDKGRETQTSTKMKKETEIFNLKI